MLADPLRQRRGTRVSPARRSIVGLTAVALAVAACGFRLQGREPLPEVMSRAYLQSADRQSQFDRLLTRELRATGVLATDRAVASAIVTIHRDETGRRILAVSATNVPEEYEVYYTVSYSVREAGGERLLSEQSLTLTRDYSYDEADVLGKAREEEILREALAGDLVRQVMRQLRAIE